MDINPNQNESAIRPKKSKLASLLQQIGINMVMIGLLILLGFLGWQRFFNKNNPSSQNRTEISNEAVSQSMEEPVRYVSLPFDLFPLATPEVPGEGIPRHTNLKTIIPSRPRVNVITYTVETGDTLFSIAQNFGIKPETVLWGNYDTLNDNPHFLKPKQTLQILPVDGTYYQWKEGDTIEHIADSFKVEKSAIINYPGNNLDLTQPDLDSGIEPGFWLIIPGGKRDIKDWGPPAITRQNAATARYYGEGACGSVYEGAVGSGTFIWPTTDRTLSGYTYDSGVHPAIDIGGQIGNPVYATDSGVVVYAGWSNYGYGYLISIDHGNGWASAYAHLSSIGVGCGQSVFQGGYIGALGSSGNSSGPHLHFELMINGAKVNPLDYVH